MKSEEWGLELGGLLSSQGFHGILKGLDANSESVSK